MLVDRVVGEADGVGTHAEPGVLFAEKQREDWLRDVHQLEVVRWVLAEMRSRSGRRLRRPCCGPGELIVGATSGTAPAAIPPARSKCLSAT